MVRPSTPPPDFDLVKALDSLEKFRALQPTRLLFSHFGPVDAVDDTLDRSAEELRLWVDLVRDARASALDLDHAVTMVREKTADRYADLLADPDVDEKFEKLNATASGTSRDRRTFNFCRIACASRSFDSRSLHGARLTKKNPLYVAETYARRLNPPIVL